MQFAIVLFITTNGVHNAADQFYAADHCFRSRTVDSITDQAWPCMLPNRGWISSGLRCKAAAIYHPNLLRFWT